MKFNLKPLDFISGHSIINPSATIGSKLGHNDGLHLLGASKVRKGTKSIWEP